MESRGLADVVCQLEHHAFARPAGAILGRRTLPRPFLTRQAEAGAKYQPGGESCSQQPLFRMRAPFFYPKADR